MDIYRISFIGHRRIYGKYKLEEEIETIAKDKLCEKEYVEFYMGRNGDFDISAASAIKKSTASYRTSKQLSHSCSAIQNEG